MEYGKPCTRCLLEQAGRQDTAKLIEEKIAIMPPKMRADDSLYKSRLDICLSCDSLVGGVCMKCGCYVQLRAAAKQSHCPSSKRQW